MSAPPVPVRRPVIAALRAWAFPALLVLWLGAHVALTNARRPFWMDELVTYLLSTDPSLPHGLDALAHGADGGGPLAYVLAWAAGRALPATEGTFRGLSFVYVAVGMIALFGVLRRAFGTWPAVAAVGVTLGGSTLVLYQSSEFRFYALLLGLSALGVGCGARWFAGRRQAVWGNALVHAALSLTHPFGLFYSGVLTAGALAGGWVTRVRTWPLAVSGVIGAAAAFGPWLPAFRQQSRVLVGDSQLPRPGVADLGRVYAQLAPSVYYDQQTKEMAAGLLHALPAPAWVGLALVVFAAAGAGAWRLRARRGGVASSTAPPFPAPTRALLVLALALVAAPLAGWMLARVGRPVFLHRYFIPSTLGFSILYAAGFARLAARWPARARKSAGVAALAAGVGLHGAWPLVSAARQPDGYAPLRARAAALAAPGLPVVCNSPQQFWPFHHYAPGGDGGPFWFVLDREVAFEPGDPVAATEFNFMSVQGAAYPRLRVVDSAAFLGAHRHFVVDNEQTRWCRERILRAPERFRVERPAGLPVNAVLVTALEAR